MKSETKTRSQSQPQSQKWAWGLSGSGHFFGESIELITQLEQVDIFVSKAAAELLKMYRKKLPKSVRTFYDTTASAVPVGRFYKGLYHTLVMAPASSNTVAKSALGLGDNLLSNIFAQAGKCRVPTIYFPCDTAAEHLSKAPKGMVRVFPRAIDLAHTNTLKTFADVKVVDSVKSLHQAISTRTKELAKATNKS